MNYFTPAIPDHLTSADFLRLAEAGAFDDMWVELVEGKVERMPAPGNDHSALQIDLLAALLSILPKALVRAECGVDLGGDTILAGDAAVLRAPIKRRGGMLRVDEIAMLAEVAVSTRERDLGFKRQRYAAAGIPVYWVIDEARRAVHVFDRPDGEDYVGIALVRFGEPLVVPGSGATITLE